MAWKKVPQAHVDAFTEALPRAEGVELKKMFGCPAGFVNGNMFCGAHELNVNVRLSREERDTALGQPGFGTFTVRNATMGEYVTLPPDKVTDVAFLRRWFLKSYGYASSLPPKQKKLKTAKKVAKASRK